MLWSWISYFFTHLFAFALHLSSKNAFPPPLSAAAEKELLEKSRAGDEAARQKLVEHNLRLVVHIAKKYYSGSLEQDDLISIGTIGLIKAVSTFRPDRGIRLATYASRCIENEILMVFRAGKKSAQDISLCDPIDTDKDGNALTLGDLLSDETDVFEDIHKKMDLQKLQSVFYRVLDEREIEILSYRYGLFGRKELTQHEIADRLGISRSYVSRIEKAALQKLRPYF